MKRGRDTAGKWGGRSENPRTGEGGRLKRKKVYRGVMELGLKYYW